MKLKPANEVDHVPMQNQQLCRFAPATRTHIFIELDTGEEIQRCKEDTTKTINTANTKSNNASKKL